jgi:hypothetical protein
MLDAADSMDATVRFGRAPFTAETYAQVIDYQNLVRGRVGEIEATCTQASARVLLDGKEWFACPATRKTRVLVAEHTVQGEHPSLFARPHSVNVSGGVVSHVRVDLVSIDDQFTTVRRFPRWVPWTVVGVSGLGLALGALLKIDAANQLDQYEQDVAGACAVNGCELDNAQTPAGQALADRLNGQRDRAYSRDKLAVGVLATAGVGVVVGIVLVVLNVGQRVRIAQATATAEGAGASLQWSF